MLYIKPFLCSSICILYFTTLTAQIPHRKNNNINSVVDETFYFEKKWNVTQIFKDSVSYQFISFSHAGTFPRMSDVSMINISMTEKPPAPVLLNVSDKLRFHLETSRYYESEDYNLLNPFSCRSLNSMLKFKKPITEKIFFNHQ